MHPIQQYLIEVQQVNGSGHAVKETSFYPALSTLFNSIGKSLKPPVYLVSILTNVGAGFPDGGFFTKTQTQTLEKETDASKRKALLKGTKPERGVLEVKGNAQDLGVLIGSVQVKKYLDEYGLVLVTNLREFALVDLSSGKAREIERFSLCEDAERFFFVNPEKIADLKGEECLEFLKRCLLTGAPLRTPQDVAAFLASYARQARLRLENSELDLLEPLKGALQSALGVTFESVDKKLSEEKRREQGERFFRATLVQTLFYGLFSAWLSHVKEEANEPFRWKEAQYSLHVPMVATLFQELIKASNLKSLGLEKLITLAAETLNRVEIGAFFEKWGDASAVQYFYEPFLERFDPTLRKELGVYYTPPEIVQYMVERVHRVLQSELGLADGLADESVMVLDPCCGTGAYVLETLRVIARELKLKKPANRVASELKKAALSRVFGFEILPAPFVVAHHGVADLLKNAVGATFKDDERAPIYLTNALTGWASEPDTPLAFAEFKEERELAQKVKQQEKILVIIGNPPYDAFAKIDEDDDLIAPYKKGLYEDWGVSKNSLQDLYIRFFRIAERKLSHGDKGVLCFISNFSYLRESSFVVMRKHLLDSFDSFWIDVLNGDSRETGKRTPEGLPDPSVFSTAFNREGIKKGTSIGLMVRGEKTEKKIVSRELWGVEKRRELLESLNVPDFDGQYEAAQPTKENHFSLRPRNVSNDYASWPSVVEFAAFKKKEERFIYNGPIERRGNSLIAFEKETLQLRLKTYFNLEKSDAEVAALHPSLMMSGNRIIGPEARKSIQEKFKYDEGKIVRYPFKPFDLRWCYLENLRPLFSEPSPELIRHSYLPDNAFFITRDSAAKQIEGAIMLFSSVICDYDSMSGHARHFPIQIRREVIEALEPDENGQMAEKKRVETVANLSGAARAYLADLELPSPDESAEIAALLWHHALAIGYSRVYREEHAGGLAADWPRVPLPADVLLLRQSAALGKQVAALLDMAQPAPGIETGKFRRELEPFGALSRADGKNLEDGDAALLLNANWGFFGERGIVQPGTQKVVERLPSEAEKSALELLGVAPDTLMLDVPLMREKDGDAKTVSFWSGVPRPVWEIVIGGYQVLKKWLSYRDERVLGRALHLGEAQEVENIVRRLTVLWSLSEKLDENYRNCADNGRPLVLSNVGNS